MAVNAFKEKARSSMPENKEGGHSSLTEVTGELIPEMWEVSQVKGGPASALHEAGCTDKVLGQEEVGGLSALFSGQNYSLC